MLNFLKKDEPVKIRFLFGSQAENKKRMTWDDLDTLEAIQNGETSSHGLKAFAARFVADDKNQYMPHDKALKLLGSLSADDIQDVLKQFVEAMQNAAIPPIKGTESNSQQGVGSGGTPLDGSQP